MDSETLWIVAFGAVGVAAVIAIAHALGRTRDRLIASADEARADWLDEHPDREPAEVAVAADGRSALVALADGGAGLIRVLGDRRVVWTLSAAELAAARADAEGRLDLRFRDPSVPPVRVPLASDEAGRLWAARLTGREIAA